jgi:hypothetical protein
VQLVAEAVRLSQHFAAAYERKLDYYYGEWARLGSSSKAEPVEDEEVCELVQGVYRKLVGEYLELRHPQLLWVAMRLAGSDPRLKIPDEERLK